MNLKSIILPSFFSLFFLLGFINKSIGQNSSEIEKKTREFVAYELQQQDLVKAKTYFNASATFQWPNGSGEGLNLEQYIQIRSQNAKTAKFEAEIKAVHVVGNESIVFADWQGTIINDPENPERVGKVAKVPFVYRFFWKNGKIERMEMYWDGRKINDDWGNGQGLFTNLPSKKTHFSTISKNGRSLRFCLIDLAVPSFDLLLLQRRIVGRS